MFALQSLKLKSVLLFIHSISRPKPTLQILNNEAVHAQKKRKEKKTIYEQTMKKIHWSCIPIYPKAYRMLIESKCIQIGRFYFLLFHHISLYMDFCFYFFLVSTRSVHKWLFHCLSNEHSKSATTLSTFQISFNKKKKKHFEQGQISINFFAFRFV